MNDNFLKAKALMESILEKTSKVADMSVKYEFEELQPFLSQKKDQIDEFNKLDKTSFSDLEKKEINEIIAKIKIIENENIKLIQNYMSSVKQETKDIKINKRLAAAYKITFENKPKMIDTKD